MEVSSIGGGSQALMAATRKRFTDQAADAARQVLEVDRQAVSKAQIAVNRSDVLYL
ncbi:MAG: hypothetical protein JWN67_3959 [Actinomycetia bacterium]|nr:hypothetical protein [Actinomycetes bacterium]